MGKVFYYEDELNDDFAGLPIERKPLPQDFEYLPKNPFRRAAAWLLHHLVATPVCFLYCKLIAAQKIVGRKTLRPYRRSGYFLYGNHTRMAGDAFTPSMVAFPRKPYLIVSRDAVSIFGLRRLVQDLGAMPVPDSLHMSRKFRTALHTRAERGNVIGIYPEAHIWPLYTGIRPFAATSFDYPVQTGKPAFAFTATYQKRRLFGRVKATVYVDGPFFPDETLPQAERKKKLRDEIYTAMVARSKNSTYSPNRFLKKSV